ncbi:MAG: BlaI/MecI/CopY family transcriptional regulator [Oscillospiraceae bacterium]|nr:BlaI/MecI/CopY family transcriptional regulator [Oscillospiraceae bacterium]
MEKTLKKLGDAELEIMLVLWEGKAPLTASCILQQLKGRRDWALSTLMTVLARLVEKGFVACDRSTRTNYYTALIGEKEYKSFEGRSFLNKLHRGSLPDLVAGLYDSRAIGNAELDELRALIDSLEDGRNG